MSKWSTQVHRTQTGTLVAEVEHTAISWGRGDQTTRTSRVPLNGGRDERAYWHDVLDREWDHRITHLWDGQPVSSGLIMGHPDYDRETRSLSVSHLDPAALIERRWSHGVGTSNGEGGYQPSGGFEVNGKSLEGALIEVLRQALVAPVVPAWPIAAIIGSSPSGGFSKRWAFHEFESASDMVSSITEQEGGPDWTLQPVKVGEEDCWWQLITGTPLTGPSFELHLDAEESAVQSWRRQSDASATATGIHYPGKGSEEDMRVGAAFLPTSAGLARDSIFWNKNESDVGRLVVQARGRLAGLTGATRQWSIEVSAHQLSPAALRLGSQIKLFLWDDDPWLPDYVLTRVVGYSGNESDFYNIEVVEV